MRRCQRERVERIIRDALRGQELLELLFVVVAGGLGVAFLLYFTIGAPQ